MKIIHKIKPNWIIETQNSIKNVPTSKVYCCGNVLIKVTYSDLYLYKEYIIPHQKVYICHHCASTLSHNLLMLAYEISIQLYNQKNQ